MKSSSPNYPAILNPRKFEKTVDGVAGGLYLLRNSSGMLVAITNYGAKIEQVIVPDRHGRLDDVVLGYDSIEGAVGGAFAIGAFVGRYAGRIENARFVLAGQAHHLSANDGPHCLHGGTRGTPYRMFNVQQNSASSVNMLYEFADGEEGFPGRMRLLVNYTVTEANELEVAYEAKALDRPTVASFTTHAFFNLNGESSGSALNHEVMVCADHYFGMTPDLIATGELIPVENTAFDLREPVLLMTRVRGAGRANDADQNNDKAVSNDSMLDGYDDCFLLRRTPHQGLQLCARLDAPRSGRRMEVWSTEPAMQFYSGVRPHEPMPGGPGKSGRPYLQQMGFCFEPQSYPNAPNRPGFPSSVYEPGQTRRGATVYRFSTAAVSRGPSSRTGDNALPPSVLATDDVTY